MSDLGNKAVMGKNIQHYMDVNGKTRKDICKDLGFSYSTFTDWVNGNSYPRIDKIELMSNYFRIKKSDLVENKDSNNVEDQPTPNTIAAHFDGDEYSEEQIERIKAFAKFIKFEDN